MKIKDRLIGALIRAPAKIKNCAEDEDERGWTSLESRRKATREIALKSASYYSCMKIRCEALAKLPLKIMQDTDKGTIPRKDHPLWELLSLRPNRFTSAYDFLWATEFQRLDTGNAFWVDDFRNGKAQALYLLDSSRVTIYIDDTNPTSPNAVYYLYNDPIKGEILYYGDEIVHFKNFSPDGIRGISMREYLSDILQNEVAAQEVLKDRYTNGMQDPLIVQYIGDYDKARQNAIKKKFESLGGAQNAGRVVPIPTEYKVSQLETKLVNSQFFELQGLSVQQIANAFGVKNFQLNDMSKATYNNVTEQNRAFYSETLMNPVISYEQEIDWVLLTKEDRKNGVYAHFNVDALLRSDPEKRMQTYVLAVNNGIKTAKECRDLEGLPYLPNTERLRIGNGAGIWLDDLGKQYSKGGENNAEQ